MSRIFITGATGYIGGEVLVGLAKSSLVSTITALVRSESRASLITNKFPSVTPVIGDLDSAVQITNEASKADVILNLASSSHLPCAAAIAQGLRQNKQKSPVWIQIAGASLLSGPEILANAYGEPRPKVYNDLQGIHEIRDIVNASPKRAVDHLIKSLPSSQPDVRTAIVYGPLIYGQGRGPANQRSIQIPDMAKVTLQRGRAIQVGRGLSAWSNVHVADIAQLVLRLALEAPRAEPSLWNENGIYFAENGKLRFGDIASRMSSIAVERGLIKSDAVEEIDAETADSLTAHGAVLWGTNAQYTADRARELLGWKPQGPSLEEEIHRAIMEEASRLSPRL